MSEAEAHGVTAARLALQSQAHQDLYFSGSLRNRQVHHNDMPETGCTQKE